MAGKPSGSSENLLKKAFRKEKALFMFSPPA
jgi:hypothetical protein